ncbi:hypothetical protein NDK43_23855 [Neobacillus pocheonensis]|uniref:ParB/Sulfiredoxin domain-containing protein n=1 Tax=Neobacillus pocheonensis TaxID=363869 RepID=A0ABT0WGZ1_9BACI|nr:hypothetical protein [Neobacillus pocheonensis]
MENRWKYVPYINSIFPREQYHFRNEKEKLIDPKKIISLSRPFEEIYTPEIEGLRKQILEQGYKRRNLVCLYEDLEGNYYVGRNGNHRAILTYELGIPEIPALVRKIRKKDSSIGR